MSRYRFTFVSVGAALFAMAVPATAQGRYGYRVPPGHLPGPGECRVWYDGVPPGHQPPPTDCVTAIDQAYWSGGRVIYGGVRWRGTGGHRYYRRPLAYSLPPAYYPPPAYYVEPPAGFYLAPRIGFRVELHGGYLPRARYHAPLRGHGGRGHDKDHRKRERWH